MSNAKPSSLDVQLLTDLHRFFAAQTTAKHIPTEQLLDYLAGIDNAPWATFAQGKAITARHLARLLQPYGIVSKNIRVGNTVPKCYRLADFNDAFAKVVAAITDVADKVTDNVENNVADSDVADRKPVVAANVAAISDDVAANVADRKPVVAANVADRKPVVAANVAAISDDVAANVAAISNVAAPVPAQPVRKWPPPKGWTWNHQTAGYEPPTPTVEAPIDQELIRQTLRVSSSLKYLPGKGLVALHEAEPCLS